MAIGPAEETCRMPVAIAPAEEIDRTSVGIDLEAGIDPVAAIGQVSVAIGRVTGRRWEICSAPRHCPATWIARAEEEIGLVSAIDFRIGPAEEEIVQALVIDSPTDQAETTARGPGIVGRIVRTIDP